MPREKNAPKFAELALPLPLRQSFTYRLPAAIGEKVSKGSRLLLPFGKRETTGYVVALHEELSPELGIEESQIKSAIELLDEEPLLTEEILKLTNWASDYYASSWGEMLKASLPAGVNVETEQILAITEEGKDQLARLSSFKTTKAAILKYLADNGEASIRSLGKNFGAATAKRAARELINMNWASAFRQTLSTKAKPKIRKAIRLLPPEMQKTPSKPLTDLHQKIIEIIIDHGGEISFADLIEKADISASAVNTLEKRGILEIFAKEFLRDPLRDSQLPELNDFELTEDQNYAFEALKEALKEGEFQAFLLHGVTGSGKTEIYIRAMRSALDQGKSALMLVPEIALTPVFSKRLRAIFGNEVAILHSNLSTGERFDEWRRIRNGSARIAIGTRSAIFAPLENIGMIIVDEEHDASYRQQEPPFYNARDLAVMRANFAKAIVILGSATPSLETFYNAKKGKYHLLSLPGRIGNRPMAKAELIDMRIAFREANEDKIFSSELLNAIEETHSKGEQSIILLNRRGFSQYVLCRSCGDSMKCRNCEITLTFHRRDNIMTCHYCGFRAKVPKKCPLCESRFIYFLGEGTEQLEDLLQKKFPHMRIERIDRDTTRRKHSFEEILDNFSAHKIDMLVGTQMLAKGHDFPNVTLVGVISVDAGMALPDFRSAERTFQLLTQVAGRAGRGDLQGRVLIQTFFPQHYALLHACEQNYLSFYDEEIRFRERLSYPPFVSLASIMIQHENLNYASDNAAIIKEALADNNKERNARILGPAPAPLARLKGKHRLQIIIKAINRKKLRELLDFALHDAQERACDMKCLNIEIDPISLM